MSVITTQQLKKIYDNDILAVDDISISIERGEVFGFLGPNGAGKSTTINMLIGMLSPTNGTIKVLGYRIPEEIDQVTDKIGYIPQDIIFFNHLTVKENLNLFAACYDSQIDTDHILKVAEQLEMSDFIDRRADTLSGGQKRRLNLAIGLLHSPEILFLDEPSAGLDAQSRNVLWDTIKRIANDGVTIIITTHLMETADLLSDRIVIIDHGKVIAEGSPKALKTKYGKGDNITFQLSDKLDNKTVEEVKKITSNITVTNNMVKMNVKNGIAKIGNLIEMMNSTVGKDNITGVELHENSLEDVFIHLTGKELRE